MKKYVSLLQSFLRQKMIIDENMVALNRERRIKLPRITNYIRISTLELVAQEIYEKNVQGAVAEVGVYKGMFAKYINQVFADRTLYLFDTFEGFDVKDVQVEKENSFSKADQNFANTSITEVLSKMKHPEKCVIKKGWFPESIGGLDESFCFVSLDADLYKPIYDGLEYFYPRLSRGGYIFIHDYNNDGYEGAKKAVREYCNKMGIGYTPMTDTWGSAIISK